MSLAEDIFTMARDKGAVAAVTFYPNAFHEAFLIHYVLGSVLSVVGCMHHQSGLCRSFDI